MQKRHVLILMALAAVAYDVSTRSSRRPRIPPTSGESAGFESRANVATLADIAPERPNEAFIPEEAEAALYAQAEEPEVPAAESDIPYMEIEKENAALRRELAGLRPSASRPSSSPRPGRIKKQDAIEELVSVSRPLPAGELAPDEMLAKAEPAPEPEKEKTTDSTGSVVRAGAPETAEASPFGVRVSPLEPEARPEAAKPAALPGRGNPFLKAFSAIRPEKVSEAPARGGDESEEADVSYVSPKLLKQDLYRTYITENEYLSPAQIKDDAAALRAKTAKVIDLPQGPLKVGSREVLQMKLEFEPASSAISGESVNIVRSFGQVAADQPTNSIEIGISERSLKDPVKKRLAARRLALVSNIFRNAGLSDRQIFPVSSNRDDDSFSFRVVPNDTFEQMRIVKGVDAFGEPESVQTYELMNW